MSLFIFCGYYLLHAISKNSFLAELCILVPASELGEKIENSVCVCTLYTRIQSPVLTTENSTSRKFIIRVPLTVGDGEDSTGQ